MQIIAVGLATPEVNTGWALSLGYEYELWSDLDAVLLEHYEALPPEESLPIRHAYILDETGRAIVLHEGAVSVGADPGAVLDDCEWLFGAN